METFEIIHGIKNLDFGKVWLILQIAFGCFECLSALLYLYIFFSCLILILINYLF